MEMAPTDNNKTVYRLEYPGAIHLQTTANQSIFILLQKGTRPPIIQQPRHGANPLDSNRLSTPDSGPELTHSVVSMPA